MNYRSDLFVACLSVVFVGVFFVAVGAGIFTKPSPAGITILGFLVTYLGFRGMKAIWNRPEK
jgi:hypothetical protein